MEELDHLRKLVADLESADAKRKQAEEEGHRKEQFFPALLEHSSDIIVVVNREGRIIYENPAIEQAIGLKPEERLGASVFEFIHPDDMQIVADAFSKLWQDPGAAVQKAEIRLHHKDGMWRAFEATGTNLVRNSAIEAVIINLRDIAERKQMEQEIRASEERFRALVESSLDVVTIVDAKGTVLYHSPNYKSIWGRDAVGEFGKDMFKDVYPDDIPLVGDAFVRLLKNPKEPVETQIRALHADGTCHNIDVIAHNHLGDQAVRGIVLTFRDTTERKRAEQALRESEENYSTLVEQAMDGVTIIQDKVIKFANKAMAAMSGYTIEELIGKSTFDLVPSNCVPALAERFAKRVQGEDVCEIVHSQLVCKDGTIKVIESATKPIQYEGRPAAMGVCRDITERKRMEEMLLRISKAVESSSDAIGMSDPQGHHFYHNKAFTELFEYTPEELEAAGGGMAAFADKNIARDVFDTIMGGGSWTGEVEMISKSGRKFIVVERADAIKDESGRVIGLVGVHTDITEHKKAGVELERAYEELKAANERMVQSEKLRAMGEMASGIAHDFNNMLAVILGRTHLIVDDVKDDKVKKSIQIIEQAALDAAKTVKRLQDFARIRVEHDFESLDVNEVVEGVLKMIEPRVIELEQTKGIVIQVERELGKVGHVSGDDAELREALLNIVLNAMDAMPTGGKLTVKSEQDKDWVQISIKDTGVGVPNKVKKRIFDPFFTTKASRGSGLGLSVTYGIIVRHGGMIKFDSAVGKGTTFYIRLPLAVESVKQEAKKRKVVAAKPANILTVDDEPEVLSALGLTLEYFGHWVKGFTRGAEAIKAFKDGNYDLVITDLGMPEISGWDVARAVKKVTPDVPVLLITGWVIDLDEEQKKIVDGVIPKPFSRDSISSAISQVLPAKKRTGARKSG